MSDCKTFHNNVGRSFAVGQYAIAHDSPTFGRSFPCQVTSQPTATEGRVLPRLVCVGVACPNASTLTPIHVDPNNLFPSFSSIHERRALPKWFAVQFFSVPAEIVVVDPAPLLCDVSSFHACEFAEQRAAASVAEAFAVFNFLHFERYETLDRWLGDVDRFVDANTFATHERDEVKRLRDAIQRNRLDALRRGRALPSTTQGAAS